MKDKTSQGLFEGLIVPFAVFCAICFIVICGIGKSIEYVAKKIWAPFDFFFVPHKENIFGKLIGLRKKRECIPTFPTDVDKLVSVDQPIFIDRYFLIIKSGTKKIARVVVSQKMYEEMSQSKGKIISLLCKKRGADEAYEPIVET